MKVRGTILFFLTIFWSVLTIAEQRIDSEKDRCQVPYGVLDSRPEPEGPATQVKVGLFLLDIMELHDALQQYRIHFRIQEQWRDLRLTTNAEGKSLAGCNVPLDHIWHPHITFINNVALRKQHGDLVRIGQNGQVTYIQRYIGTMSSRFDLKDFPLDTQQLSILAVSLYGPNELSIVKDPGNSGWLKDFSLAGWSFSDGSVETGVYRLERLNRELSKIVFSIKAKRISTYYVWKIMVPIGLIVMMASAVFWIDPKQVGPQLGVATATIFTLVAFQLGLGQLLPKVSYLTRMDLFLLFSTILIFLVLAEVLWTSHFANSGRLESSRNIDRRARMIYPLLFALCVFIPFWM